MQVDTIGSEIFQNIVLPSEVKNIDAFVHSRHDSSVFLYDGISKKIFHYKIETEELEVLVDNYIGNIVSMDIGTLLCIIDIYLLKPGKTCVLFKHF